jgi:tetratricopeptide (TPR) repeat protein
LQSFACFSRWAVSVLLLSAVLAENAAAQQDPVVAPDLGSAEAYLAPLVESRADEDAFVAKLFSLGDEEVLRLSQLSGRLGRLAGESEESVAIRSEMAARKSRLEWLCDASLKHYAESARVRNFRGNLFYDNLNRRHEAAKEWHMAVSLDSKFSEPYNNLGMHYFHNGNYALGFQNMDKALDLEPGNPDFCFNMAQNYLLFRKEVEKKRGWSNKRVYKEAMKLSKRAVKSAPEDYQLLEDYAVNFLAAEGFGLKTDWKDAARAWKAAREHAPNKVKLFYTWLNEGRAWKQLDRDKDARRCFESALEILPGNEVAQRLLNGLDQDAS